MVDLPKNGTSRKEYFEAIASRWDEIIPVNTEVLEEIIQKCRLKRGDHVLDVGTGTGVALPFLLTVIKDEGKITAIDYAASMIDRAKEKFPPGSYPNLNFINADITTFDFLEKFDAVICLGILPHLDKPQETIHRLAAVLKPKGKLLIAHIAGRETVNKRHQSKGSGPENPLYRDLILPMEEIEEMVSNAGLTTIHSEDETDRFFLIALKL